MAFDWLTILRKLCLAGTVLNILSLFWIVTGLIIIKRWIKETSEGLRKWRWLSDGLFLIYLVKLAIISVLDLTIVCFLYFNEIEDFVDKIQQWEYNESVSYFIYFVLVAVYTSINFFMTIFAIYTLEKMSHALWSHKYKDEKMS